MSVPAYTTVTRTQGNNRALKAGEVTPRTCMFDFVEVDPLIAAFRRMVRGLEFDICEMAITTYITAREYGTRFTALPVFLARGFHHGAILVDPASGVRSPKDLEGKRVGVNRGYSVTTGVWVRGILQNEYGVDLSRITWVLSGDEHVEHFRRPANVVGIEPGKKLPDMLASGEIAAAIGIDAGGTAFVPLIPDADEAGYRALRERGTYPINHLVVIKDDVLGAQPALAADVFEAFAEAKRRYVKALREGAIEKPNATDAMYRRVMDITGGDPLPYGIAPNRAVIEELVGHAMTQQIITQRPAVDDLFAPATRELTA